MNQYSMSMLEKIIFSSQKKKKDNPMLNSEKTPSDELTTFENQTHNNKNWR